MLADNHLTGSMGRAGTCSPGSSPGRFTRSPLLGCVMLGAGWAVQCGAVAETASSRGLAATCGMRPPRRARSTIARALALALVCGVVLLSVEMALRWVAASTAAERLAAIAGPLGELAASAIGVAIALATVVWALDLDRQRVEDDQHAARQLKYITEAYDWLADVVETFGRGHSMMLLAADSTMSMQRAVHQGRAQEVMQRFYDEGQGLRRMSLLADVIDDAGVGAALIEADGLLRSWNESVAGDHSDPTVDLEGADLLSMFGRLSELEDLVRARMVEAMRS